MKVKVGQTVVVSTWDGLNKTVVVQAVLRDVKNGRPGIDYVDTQAEFEFDKYGWAYSTQILRIV